MPTRRRLILALAPELDRHKEPPAAKGRTFLAYRPYGVVPSIVPWNAPNSLAFSQTVSALLAGNAVALKPPETCPLTVIQSVALLAQVLPLGVLNVVTGLPSEIGDALTPARRA